MRIGLPARNSTACEFPSVAAVSAFDNSELLAEADHRIANHLTLLLSYLRLKTADIDRQREAPSRQAIHVLLDGVGAQIAAIAKLHRAMVPGDLTGPVDLGLHLHEVCAPFAQGLGGTSRIVEDFEPGCVVRRDQILPLSQIAAEVVTNALKHSGDSAEPGLVRVRCLNDETGAVRIEVIDDGEGFAPGFDPSSDGGYGFRLVRGLGQQLGARIDFESTPLGVCFRLTLPEPPPAARPLAKEAKARR
ncbi:MAG: sensor histidine kinase [Phenylobacterium sp.]